MSDLPEQPAPETPIEPAAPVVSAPAPKSHGWLKILLCFVVIIAVAAAAWAVGHHAATPTSTAKTTPTPSTSASAQGLTLDTRKNYGNKYANGVLPVGDGKYSSSSAQKGYVYTCASYAQNLSSSSGGAQSRGPWFQNNNTEYDTNKKLHVSGSVMWQADMTNSVVNGVRSIVTNDLPTHPTGIFPIASTDAAYQYDKNPNSIKGQTLTYSLNANPTYGSPQCMGGEVGVMTTGVALFNAFDAGGRDAGAWEIQDSCSGHPQSSGLYHYHTLSSCIKDVSVRTVIGYALDGFPITGPQVSTGNYLTTDDLDECHGIVSQITLDGKKVTMYHYVMTQDFPYSVSCFRSSAITPPDLGSGQQTGSAQQGPPPRP